MTQWVKYWGRDYTYHYAEVCLRAQTTRLEIVGHKSLKKALFFRKDGIFNIYSSKEDKEDFQLRNRIKFTKDTEALRNFIRQFLAISKKYQDSAKLKKELSNSTTEELFKSLRKYYNAWVDYHVCIWVIWNLSETYSDYLLEYFTDKAAKLGKSSKIDDYFNYMSRPSKKSSILHLDETISKMKKQGIKPDIDKLFKEYVWMPWGDLHASPWTKEDIKKYLENHKVAEEKSISFTRIIKELNLSKKEIEMIKLNREIAYLRDYRDEVRRKTVYRIRFLYKEIAKRLDVAYEDLMYYSTPEILEHKKLSADDIRKRKGDTISIIDKGKYIVYSGSEMQAFQKKENFHPYEQTEQSQIKGVTASKGYAIGKVKIIRLDSELSKIQKGDVMVAVTTHPEYTTKMQIASAIVTDEGGLACHAAIVARELGIPCIVGTKNATSILRDGDFVEVDADKGIVRKIG